MKICFHLNDEKVQLVIIVHLKKKQITYANVWGLINAIMKIKLGQSRISSRLLVSSGISRFLMKTPDHLLAGAKVVGWRLAHSRFAKSLNMPISSLSYHSCDATLSGSKFRLSRWESQSPCTKYNCLAENNVVYGRDRKMTL